MTTHHMHLHAIPFTLISSGEKTIEYRLNDEKRERVAVGDTIIFMNREDASDPLTVKVVALHRANTFSELLDDKEKIRALAQYYTARDQERFGVVGIEFILVT